MKRAIEPELVYVVDDVEGNRILAQAYLEILGWRVRAVPNALAALAALRDALPEAMLVDVRMPGIHGDELARLLKATDATRNIRIVGYTAHALPDEVCKFRDAGFDEVLIKPVLMPQMRRTFGVRP